MPERARADAHQRVANARRDDDNIPRGCLDGVADEVPAVAVDQDEDLVAVVGVGHRATALDGLGPEDRDRQAIPPSLQLPHRASGSGDLEVQQLMVAGLNETSSPVHGNASVTSAEPGMALSDAFDSFRVAECHFRWVASVSRALTRPPAR